MYFDSVADALAMGGHGVFVWGAYGISFVIIFFVLLRPVMSIRTLNAGIRQEALRNKVHRLHNRTRVIVHPKRKQRLIVALVIVVLSSVTIGLITYALRGNINLFYSPSEVAAGNAPIDRQIRVGGMVVEEASDVPAIVWRRALM